jgi:hypothetical protein
MAKLQSFRESYYYNSGKVSDNVRSLCLSAVAVIWLFKQEANNITTLPGALYWALLWVIAALAADFFQYLYASTAWAFYARRLEKQNVDDSQEILAPRSINWPTDVLFFLKIAFALLVYVQIFRYLFEAIRHT